MLSSPLPQLITPAFARTYERTATRITAPVSFAALEHLGSLGRGVRLLDIGAGAGALSILAAHAGASVTAIDIAPGMVDLLSDRLAPFPDTSVRVMDGEALAFEDGTFDLTASIFGISLFKEWRRGLSEQVRVLRSSGRTVLATWRTPPGGGPFVIMSQAMRVVFPDRASPPTSKGFILLSDPARMNKSMSDAGLTDVNVIEIEAEWKGPSGQAYLDELHCLHSYMPAYAALQTEERARVDKVILSLIDQDAVDGTIVLKTGVVLGLGTRCSASGPWSVR